MLRGILYCFSFVVFCYVANNGALAEYVTSLPSPSFTTESSNNDSFLNYNNKLNDTKEFFVNKNGIVIEPYLGIGYAFGILDQASYRGISYTEVLPDVANGFLLKAGAFISERFIVELVLNNLYGGRSSASVYGGKLNTLSIGLDIGVRLRSGFYDRLNYVLLAGVSSISQNISYDLNSPAISQLTTGGFFFGLNAGAGLELNLNNRMHIRFDIRRVFIFNNPTMSGMWNGNLSLGFKI